MSTKQFKGLKNLSSDELKTKARELEGNLFQARMKRATGQLEDTASIWRMRKDLARVRMLSAPTVPGKSAAAAPAAAKVKG